MILPEREGDFHHQQIEYWYLVCENLSPLENLSVIVMLKILDYNKAIQNKIYAVQDIRCHIAHLLVSN